MPLLVERLLSLVKDEDRRIQIVSNFKSLVSSLCLPRKSNSLYEALQKKYHYLNSVSLPLGVFFGVFLRVFVCLFVCYYFIF